jgi:hypothetical protein
MLMLGFCDILVQKIKTTGDLSIMKTANWALCNLCRGEDVLHPTQKNAMVGYVKALINLIDDKESVVQTLYGMSDLMNDFWVVELVLNNDNFVETLLQIGEYYKGEFIVVRPLAKIVNFVSAGDSERLGEKLISSGFIKAIFKWGQNPKLPKKIVTTFIGVLGNVLMNSNEQAMTVMNSEDRFKFLLAHCYSENDEVRGEAIWALCSFLKVTTSITVAGLIKAGIFKMFKDQIHNEQNKRCLLCLLEGVNQIFSKEDKGAQGHESFQILAERIGLLDQLESLFTHPNTEVYEFLFTILDTHFEIEQENDLLSTAELN